MPYYRRYGRRSSTRKKTPFSHARSRTVNKRVKSALKVGSKKARTKVGANRRAIYTLGKQVNLLQRQKFGQKQWLYQTAELSNLIPEDIPRLQHPLCFNWNSFYDDTRIYQGSIVPGGIPGAGGTPLTHSTKSFRNKSYTPLAFLEPQFQWNARSSTDATVSLISYLPVFCSFVINFRGDVRNQANPTYDFPLRYRITLMKMKNRLHYSGFQNFALPTQLGAYHSLCSDDPSDRIGFSKTYHDVLVDKWVTINEHPVVDSDKPINRSVKINWSFPPNKPLKPNFKANEPGSVLYNNIPALDSMWLIISGNQPSTAQTSPLEINLSRYVVWRDAHSVTL